MATILVYGDSLAWGHDPATGARHRPEDRWPTVLADLLGDAHTVIVDAMRGRTTAFEDATGEADRNGARLLPSVLYTHAPLDVVVIALGTNDLKTYTAGSAAVSGYGMVRLLEVVAGHRPRVPGAGPPAAIVVSPPQVVATPDPLYGRVYPDAVDESRRLAERYRAVAQAAGAGFVDAAQVAHADPRDGVHLDATNSRAIAVPVAEAVAAHLAGT